jgi:hypothetical protein
MSFFSRNLPLDSKLKAVMVMADTDPPYIMGVSNSFEVLRNSPTLTTKKSHYYVGELVDVTFFMNQTIDKLETWFAWIGLFHEDAQDYSLPPLNNELYYLWKGNPMQFSSRNLPVDSKLKAVMVMADTNPPYVLGVSNSFDILLNSAMLTTDESQYFVGELIDVTLTMNQTLDNPEYKFAWIGLFRHDVQDYSLTPLKQEFYYPWMANPMHSPAGTCRLTPNSKL